MNILFVTDLCPIKDEEKGLPLALLNFILDFKHMGHNVTVLRPNVILNVILRKRKIYKEGEYSYKGVKCINKNFLTPFFTLRDFNFLKKEPYKNEKFDIILAHMPSGVLAANRISKLLKIPYFASVHSSDIEVIKNPLYFYLKFFMKRAFKGAKKVLPRSYWLKDEIEKKYKFLKNKTFVIPSGIETETLIEREKIQIKADKFLEPVLTIFAAGSLIKRKNFKNLITAVSKMEDIRLVIAGGGQEEKNLKKLVCKLKCDKKIEFKGRLKREKILKIMEETPVFILPSKKETFGLVYLEAMAKGCIVLCSKNSGMAGFIKDNVNGFLIEPDCDSIKNAIEKIRNLKNPEIIMNKALDTAISMEREKMAENYINIIQNILV